MAFSLRMLNSPEPAKTPALRFVGPKPELLEKMGDKVAAKKAADLAGVPTLPATPSPVSKATDALKWGRKIGFPLIIKAAFGGGGRGMRVVNKEEDLKPMLEEAQEKLKELLGIQQFFLSVTLAEQNILRFKFWETGMAM